MPDPSELLKAVVGCAPIVLFALDAEGVFTLSAGRGLNPGEVVGKSVFDVYKDNPAGGTVFTIRLPLLRPIRGA